MEQIQLLIFSVLIVFAAAVAFDFIIFQLKSTPKRSHFTLRTWYFGLTAMMLVTYWFMNGSKFW